MTARLFTVAVTECCEMWVPAYEPVTWFECDFAGIHFSRFHESDLQYWVRVAARKIYGPQTQVIFVHEESP